MLDHLLGCAALDDDAACAMLLEEIRDVDHARIEVGRDAGTRVGVAASDATPALSVDPVPTLDLYAVWRADEIDPTVNSFLDCLESSESARDNIAQATPA